MVKVTIYKDPDGRYEGFDCTGHARYADVGQDIVCAGVSALVINTINSVENLTENACQKPSQMRTTGDDPVPVHKDRRMPTENFSWIPWS